jgi:LPPG:FO 2-phospho-L-lactate transferase
MLAQRLGVRHAIVPMSDEPVRTFVSTDQGELPFQEYFVRRRCEPRVSGFSFCGSESARVPHPLRELIDSGEVDAVIVCPSNPYVSIEPLLAIKEIRHWLDRRDFPTVAVSPIVGGRAVKGPAAKMMHELGFESSVTAVAQHYGALVDGWVIDRQDARAMPEIERLGKRVTMTDTMMTDRTKSVALAEAVMRFTRDLVAWRQAGSSPGKTR